MFSRFTGFIAIGLLAGVVGCSDKPHEYGRQRPPVGDLDSRDQGLQSKDVVSSSDAMANSIMTDIPELRASPERWTIVVDRVENITGDRRQNFDIFIQRLKVRLAQLGHGQVQLVENRDKLRELQSRELDQPGRDPYGQGGTVVPQTRRLEADFALYARMMEMPNRATSYFMCEFSLTALRNTPQHQAGEQVWLNMYEVKVER